MGLCAGSLPCMNGDPYVHAFCYGRTGRFMTYEHSDERAEAEYRAIVAVYVTQFILLIVLLGYVIAMDIVGRGPSWSVGIGFMLSPCVTGPLILTYYRSHETVQRNAHE